MTEIFCAIDYVLLVDDYNDPQKHKHWAKHICVSLSGKMNCIIEDKTVECDGIMVSSNVLHTIETQGKVLVYLFDETTDVAKEIDEKYLKSSKYKVVKSEDVKKIKNIWNENMLAINYCNKVRDIYLNTNKEIFKVLDLDTNKSYIKDDRIKKVLSVLKNEEEINEGIIEELAKKVFLSKSRLSHLFKKETNISLNSFLVIMKIAKTYKYVLDGKNITEASIMAGFNSPSHFATTNKNMFGITTNELKNNIRVIQM